MNPPAVPRAAAPRPHHRPPNNLLEREAARPGLDDGGADARPVPGRSPLVSAIAEGVDGRPPRPREEPPQARGTALSPGAGEA